jgi:hypothetical protein
MVNTDSSFSIAAADAQQWSCEMVSCMSGKVWDTNLSVFYRLPTEGIPKVVSLGEETPRSGTRRCKEHKT